MTMTEIISVRGLAVGYDQRPVLSGLDFSIPRGEVTVIVGTSGCGKSTLLKSLMGLVPPLAGEVLYQDEPLDFQSEKALRSFHRRTGVLFQDGALLNSLTLLENVALPLRMEFPGLSETIIAEMARARLAQVGLAGDEDKRPPELSGGMRKRGALARAIIQEPEILFCDEPSSGLDPLISAGLDELLLDFKAAFGETLVVVTHELRSIRRIADRVLVLHNGRLHASGRLEDIQASRDPFIEAFFLREARHDD
jgi:phospholipid/cholesterol/gamma-HCH transport system ATP-binding protein